MKFGINDFKWSPFWNITLLKLFLTAKECYIEQFCQNSLPYRYYFFKLLLFCKKYKQTDWRKTERYRTVISRSSSFERFNNK